MGAPGLTRWLSAIEGNAAVPAAAAPPEPAAPAIRAAGKDYAMSGPPTISKSVFHDALVHHASPAIVDFEKLQINSAMAEVYYDIPVAFTLDPNVALAFFLHESGMGKEGYAAHTLNWGNLREGQGQIKNDGAMAYYSWWGQGLYDWCRLIKESGLYLPSHNTVSKVTPVYAPSADQNSPAQYADAVNQQCALWEGLSAALVAQRAPRPAGA